MPQADVAHLAGPGRRGPAAAVAVADAAARGRRSAVCAAPLPTGLPFTGFYWVLPSFTGFYRALPGFTRLYGFIPGFNGFEQVLPGFNGFYRILPAFNVFIIEL